MRHWEPCAFRQRCFWCVKYTSGSNELYRWDIHTYSACLFIALLCKCHYVAVNGTQPTSLGDVRSLRRELQIIRDRVNAILDRIEPAVSPSSSGDSSLPEGGLSACQTENNCSLSVSLAIPIILTQKKNNKM